jgi:GNAT superfamily N-acetyltransferase
MDALKFEVWDQETCIAHADELAAFLEPIFGNVFGEDDWADYGNKLRSRTALAAIVALDPEGGFAGLKMGYERNRTVFNSQIGAVAPHYRGQGLAATLMEKQHAWAKAAGYKGIETATLQHNRAMGIVNLKGGFVVAGIDIVPGTPTKVIFYKDLSE